MLGEVELRVWRNEHDEPVTSPSQQRTICVTSNLLMVLERVASTYSTHLPTLTVPKVVVAPTNDRQVQFKPLAAKLGHDVFESATGLWVPELPRYTSVPV